MKLLGSKLRVKARELHTTNKGMVPFIFGRDYRPNMMPDEANKLTQVERLAISLIFKTYATDSIVEHMVSSLKEIQQEKTLSNEECGEQFA